MNVRGKRIFLSGPMTGAEGFGADAFGKAERSLVEAGAAYVYNPAKLLDLGSDRWAHESCMVMTLHALTSFMRFEHPLMEGEPYPCYDAVVLLDGHGSSEGAAVEAEVARAIGVPMYEIGEVLR